MNYVKRKQQLDHILKDKDYWRKDNGFKEFLSDMHDKVSMGYGSNKTKETQSINFGFYTSKPSEDEMKIFIELFVSKWMRMGNR